MGNYIEKLMREYVLTPNRDKDENFAQCIITLDSWQIDDELRPLLKYFTITKDNRVAILLSDISIYKTLNEYQQKEFLNLLELIVKSKYDRNATDETTYWQDRVNLFFKVARKEIAILKYLQANFPEYNFTFSGENINGINEHYYLFSGYGKYLADITSNIGPAIYSEITIEIKPQNALINEQDYNADLIIRYAGNKATVEEPFNYAEVFKDQELLADNPQDNKKLMYLKLVDNLKNGFTF